MADIVRCDGGCGAESPDKSGQHLTYDWMTVIVRNHPNKLVHRDDWRKHRLCPNCASKNVFLPAHGEMVSTHGFASDALR
jgi:ribosomal protein S27AE